MDYTPISNEEARQHCMDYYRMSVSLLYREIGVIEEKHHKKTFDKARLVSDLFEWDPQLGRKPEGLWRPEGSNAEPSVIRKDTAMRLYEDSVDRTAPSDILALYVEEAGLTLEDLQTAFGEGAWGKVNRFGEIKGGWGGPNWERIAWQTSLMGDALEGNEVFEGALRGWSYSFPTLNHNNGVIGNKFENVFPGYRLSEMAKR